MTDHHSVRFTLLDQQVVDADGRRIGRVDDLLCDDPGPGG
jgi:sporulation protein YlmC with PRC-barrel domain